MDFETLQPYRVVINGLPGYVAGLPSYPRNFSRDTFLAGILSMDADQLESQVAISGRYQGRRSDAHTGEEPGKIHHEYPGVELTGRTGLTTYNACDTTALFIIAIEALRHCDRQIYDRVAAAQQINVLLGASYILSHLHGGIFYESSPEGAQMYALRVTYWKDSIIPSSEHSEIIYPVAYALAHFQAARAIEAAAHILKNTEMAQMADEMFRAGINTFLQPEGFVVAKGSTFTLTQESSDELHALAYIPTRYKDELPIEAILARARDLTTAIGIACTPQTVSEQLSDRYHGYVVWPFEQGYIHYGSTKFGLSECAQVAATVEPYIKQGQELLEVTPKIKPAGNRRQLWSVAAGLYFAGRSSLRTDAWL